MSESQGVGGTGAGPAANQERVYPNIKYRQRHVPPAAVTWLVLYFALGLVMGHLTRPWLGVLWMVFGAIPFASFTWRCLFPQLLVADRDGFRLERPGRRIHPLAVRLLHVAGFKRVKVDQNLVISLPYARVHEARWEETRGFWRRLIGPLVFLEPVWPAQRGGERRLVISHAGDRIILREDEVGRLEEFVETLRTKNILGLARHPGQHPGRPVWGDR